MNLSGISVVLVRPEENRNIGAVCRAMANSGMSSLRIIGKKEDYDDEKIRVLAIHAAYIWEQASFFSSITQACADCIFSAGTTRRRGKNRKGKLLLPEELAEQVFRTPSEDYGGEPHRNCAVVFGNERTGLTDEELAECTLGVTIPASQNFGSLNLSHAVQIICYTLFRAARPCSPGFTPLPLARLDNTLKTITASLEKIGFFTQIGPAGMHRFWRSILSRAALSEGEAAYLEYIFSKTAGLAGKNREEK
jgi:tRNA/rRNA methyltransferase